MQTNATAGSPGTANEPPARRGGGAGGGASGGAGGRAYVHQHVVSFEETNLVGNVYFVRHLAWQGRCREMFLRAEAPSVIDELGRDLRLVTLRCACEYHEELRAFDEVTLEMRLTHLQQHRIGLAFSYLVGGRQAAAGTQEIGCMRQQADGSLRPCPPPTELAHALEAYGADGLTPAG